MIYIFWILSRVYGLQVVHIYINNPKYYYFNSLKKNMKWHNNMCLLMSVLYNNIKIDINTNNDQLLETIWEHMKEVREREVILLKLKFSSLLSLFFIFVSHFQSET